MCTPADNTRHSKYRSEQFLWDSKHCINKSAVEIDICTYSLVDGTFLTYDLRCHPLYHWIKLKFFFLMLFICEHLNELLKCYSSRIWYWIYRMTHTVNKPSLVKCFFADKFFKIRSYLILVSRIFYICLKILHHLNNFDVGTTMLRSFERW